MADSFSKKSDANKAYASLAKYFGLRARDSYLNAFSDPVFAGPEGAKRETGVASLLEELFSEGRTFKSIDTIKSTSFEEKDVEEVCITPTTAAMGLNAPAKTILNGKRGADHAGFIDQGFGPTGGDPLEVVRFLNSFLDDDDASKQVSAFQVFPMKTGVDIGSTEIASLFLNSLRTLEISRAVPYLEVTLSRESLLDDDGNFQASPAMSLGRFAAAAGASKNGDRAAFVRGSGGESLPEGTFAGMDIFTTPQTLVGDLETGDITKDRQYQRFSRKSLDPFRPFLSIVSLQVDDTDTGAGTISYKTATLSLKLHDKGRLKDVADIVSPKRDATLRFSLTYGWSHPDGTRVGRDSDAQQNQRLGSLIDSMKVTELYSVYNSSYSIQQDGSVDINVKLSMVGSKQMINSNISDFSVSSAEPTKDKPNPAYLDLANLSKRLNSIGQVFRSKVSQRSVSISLPTFITSPSVSGLISMSDKDAKQIVKLLKTMQAAKTKDQQMVNAMAELIVLLDGKDKGRKAIHNKREQLASNFVKKLKNSGDPFLRESSKGATIAELGYKKAAVGKCTDLKKFRNVVPKGGMKYVSYGKLVISAMTGALSPGGEDGWSPELQFVFGSFNPEAGAAFDYNIAQFPIPISTLEAQLKLFFKTTMQINVYGFIKFLNDKFMTNPGMAGFGMGKIYKKNAVSPGGNPQANRKSKKLIEDKDKDGASALALAERTTQMMTEIYGPDKRSNPTFRSPRINVHFTTRPSSANPETSITRILIHDRAAGRFNTSAAALISSLDRGHCLQEDYSSPNKSYRTPDHNSLYSETFKKLSEPIGDGNALIKKLTDTKGPDEFAKTFGNLCVAKAKKIKGKVLKESDQVIKTINSFLGRLYIFEEGQEHKLRKFFFDESPYLAYGIEGSGILTADLSAQTNDTLSSIMLTKQVRGQGESSGAAGDSSADPGLPMMLHPAQLSMTVIGCPHLRLFQKYFVDFGTDTTLDNYYVITSLSHSVQQGAYTSQISLMPYDVYGRFVSPTESYQQALAEIIAGLIVKNKPRGKGKKQPVDYEGICKEEALRIANSI